MSESMYAVDWKIGEGDDDYANEVNCPSLREAMDAAAGDLNFAIDKFPHSKHDLRIRFGKTSSIEIAYRPR